MAKTKAKVANRDSYAGIPQSARAEVKKDLHSFREMFSPQTVYQSKQDTTKRKEEAEKAQDLQKRAKEKRVKLSQEGNAKMRTVVAKIHNSMRDLYLHVGLLKAGVDGVLPMGHIDENDLQTVCARSAFEALHTMYGDFSDLESLFDLGEDWLGEELLKVAQEEAEHG